MLCNLDYLEEYIDKHYNRLYSTMNKDKPDDNKKSKGNLTPKDPVPNSLSSTGTTPSTSPKPPCCTERHSTLNVRIALIEVIHKDFQELRHSLEFSQEQRDTLTKENTFFKGLRSHSYRSTHLRCHTKQSHEREHSGLTIAKHKGQFNFHRHPRTNPRRP